jgi:hypothetical protein
LNGVTKAVNDPRNFVLAAMGFLQTLKKRHDRNWISIHIGSGDQAKGLYGYGASALFRRSFLALTKPPLENGPSRDFAAVMAQTGAAATF